MLYIYSTDTHFALYCVLVVNLFSYFSYKICLNGNVVKYDLVQDVDGDYLTVLCGISSGSSLSK